MVIAGHSSPLSVYNEIMVRARLDIVSGMY